MDDREEKLEVEQMKLAMQDVLDENWGQLKKKTESSQKVVVVDVNVPFKSMVTLMVKWAIASIPAFIVLVFIVFFIANILRGLLG
jgi:hypothetical protein